MKARLIFVSFFTTLLIAVNVFAISIDQAKQQGLVGEQLDGYLGAVQSTPEVNALVSDINHKRRQKYEEISRSNGTSLANVEILAGKKAVENSAAGSYVKAPNGTWLRK